MNLLHSTTDPNRKFYNFAAAIPNGTITSLTASCLSASSIRLDWTEDATNNVGNVIYRSTDGINYTFLTQVANNTNAFVDTGLLPNTTYFYRLYVVTEGKLSATTALATVSATTLTTSAIFSIASGNWNTPATWSTNTVPTATDNVVIGCPTGHTVTVNIATAACNNLTILSGSNLTISNNNGIVINGNLTVNDGGALPKITMNSTNPTLTLRGHWIDLDQTVIAAGNNGILDPGTSSTVTFGGTANQIINANNAIPTLATIQSTKPMIFHNLVIDGTDVDLIYNDNKPIIIRNNLTVNAARSFTYNLNMVMGGVGNIELQGNMINNGTIYSRNDGRHFLMSGAARTITGNGIYTNFPLQIGTTASVSLNTNASMRALWVLAGGIFTVENTPRTYTLTRSAVGNTSVELRNEGTLNFSGANIVLGTTLDGTATANLINTGTFNAGTNSNFTFSGAGEQTVSNTTGVSPTITATAPAYSAAVNIPNNTANLSATPTLAELTGSGGASMSITVPAGTYTGLTSIAFNILHPRTDNLDIFLVAPDNTIFEISTDNGGNNANYLGTVISDGGATNITAGAVPFQGTFRPEGSTLNSYNTPIAKPLVGTWTLWVVDDNNNNSTVGSLLNFRLNLGNAVYYAGRGDIEDNVPTGGIAAGNAVPTAAQLFASAASVAAVDIPVGTYIGLASINFSIAHNWVADLDLYLVAPNNTVYVISTDNGGGNSNYTNTTISDAGATNISAGTAPFTGTFQPEVGTFVSYPAANCSGRWYLYAFDDATVILGAITAFSVTVNQPPTSPTLTFHNLIMNNTSTTGTRLLDTQITINNATTFTNGRLYTSEAFRVNYIAGASTSVASTNSYIVGWARKIGWTNGIPFEFPLGNDDGGTNRFAAPIRFTPNANANATTHFTATYRRITPNTGSPADNGNVNTAPLTNVAPYPILTKEVTINHVSNVEYWILERTNGTATGTVHLSYDNIRSGGASVPADLLVCRWNSGTPIWENKGNGGTSTASGFNYVQSTANTFTAFSPVTLASTTRLNILPVTWLSFEVVGQDNNAFLQWQTQTETDNAKFEVERSLDGMNFSTIATINGFGNSSTNKTYTFTDKNITELGVTILYYRIKQIDTNKSYSYTTIKSLMLDKVSLRLRAYPNPLKETLTIHFSTKEADSYVSLRIIDATGRVWANYDVKCYKGENTYQINTEGLAVGTYVLHLFPFCF
jgi:subtilisin-like proprotein convertase family protein